MSVGKNGEKLVFLVSLPRSGSTMLSLMLDGHPQLHCPQEPWILYSLLSQREGDTVDPVGRQSILGIRSLMAKEDFLPLCRDFAASVYSKALMQRGRCLFVDKTPLYAWYLHEIREMFPDAGLIWLKRDPLDVAASYMNTWHVLPEELVDHPHDLRRCCRNLLSFFDGDRGRTMELSYEALVADPESAVRRVCEFIGVPYVAAVLNYDSDKARVLTLGDVKVRQHTRPHRESVGAWQRDLNREQQRMLRRFFGSEVLRRMGHMVELIDERPAAAHRFCSAVSDEGVMGQSDENDEASESEAAAWARLRRYSRYLEHGAVHLHEAYVRLHWRMLGLRHRSVCLLGAGRYARWLIDVVADEPAGPEIVEILDDAAAPGAELAGIPVIRPWPGLRAGAAAVVLATDDPSSPLRARARELFGVRGAISLYQGVRGAPFPKSGRGSAQEKSGRLESPDAEVRSGECREVLYPAESR